MANNIMLSQEYRLMVCPTCGIGYAAPEWYMKQRENYGNSWHCPNGHSLSYTATEIDKLKKQAEQDKRAIEQAHAREAEAYRQLKKAQTEKKKLAKRLESGVCPVAGCKRHFTNLQRHIETEHKGVAIEVGVQTKQIAGAVQ